MSLPDTMPEHVGVRFAHAAVQVIADSAGVDVLHIKGPAVDPTLLELATTTGDAGVVGQTRIERHSVDADVLVRPSHVGPLIAAMRRHGWVLKVDFPDGSAFEHAATLAHPVLAHVDVHRYFPGFGQQADKVFAILWRDRRSHDIAGQPCPVPDQAAQRLLLILNAVRGGPAKRSEIDRLWEDAAPAERQLVQQLAADLGAEVALAAGTGRLHEYHDFREHDLWQILSTGQGSPIGLWRARVRAQPTWRAALREAVRRVVPNSRRLAFQLGHPPTQREIAAAWGRRLDEGLRALAESMRLASDRRQR